MFKVFQSKKESNEIKNKNILNKELFNSASKKKVITQAARESAEDQRKLLEDYKRILESNSHCTVQ